MEEYFVILGLTCLGWVSGKLINLFADYSPGRIRPAGSICTYCGRRKPAIHYISILYSCPYCSAPYPKRVWIVDLFSISGTLILGMIIDDSGRFLLTWMVAIYLLTTMVIDLERHMIYHKINLYGTILCGATGFYLSGWETTLAGGLTGLVTMFIIYGCGILYFLFKHPGRIEAAFPSAVGFGDVFFCGNIGLFIGSTKIIPAIFFGIFLAGIIGLFIKTFQQFLLDSRGTLQWIPISPFFVVSAVIIEILPNNPFFL